MGRLQTVISVHVAAAGAGVSEKLFAINRLVDTMKWGFIAFQKPDHATGKNPSACWAVFHPLEPAQRRSLPIRAGALFQRHVSLALYRVRRARPGNPVSRVGT
jgi:hypothetical protein